jgi:steroid delta-isomerase-like uncharacterized protein
MTPDDVRALVARFYAQVWNAHDAAAIAALLHPDVTFRGSLGDVRRGRAGVAAYVDAVHAAIGGYRCEVVELVVEPPKAFARMRFHGVHRGPLLGHPPTGRHVAWDGAALFAVRDGRIADVWVLGDVDGLRAQLADG